MSNNNNNHNSNNIARTKEPVGALQKRECNPDIVDTGGFKWHTLQSSHNASHLHQLELTSVL